MGVEHEPIHTPEETFKLEEGTADDVVVEEQESDFTMSDTSSEDIDDIAEDFEDMDDCAHSESCDSFEGIFLGADISEICDQCLECFGERMSDSDYSNDSDESDDVNDFSVRVSINNEQIIDERNITPYNHLNTGIFGMFQVVDIDIRLRNSINLIHKIVRADVSYAENLDRYRMWVLSSTPENLHWIILRAHPSMREGIYSFLTGRWMCFINIETSIFPTFHYSNF